MSRFTLVCGPDDFLVQRAGGEVWSKFCAEVPDEFSREVINGFAGNVAEVEAAVRRFREAVETLDMFGGRKAVWFKDVNFLGDTPTGRSEGAKHQVELLQASLAAVDPAGVAVLLTASPVDRRLGTFKWFGEHGTVEFQGALEGDAGAAAMAGFVMEEAKRLGVVFEPAAVQLLLERTDQKSRILVQEVGKLAAFAATEGAQSTVTVAMVDELTPNFAEGDFFEASEHFFRRKLQPTLDAIRRHFFAGGDARPLLTSLQNRGRLLLQLRALSDSGQLTERGVNKAALEKVAARYATHFEGVTEKSSFHITSQHPFYLAQLAEGARLFTVPELLSLQLDFVEAFQKINNPDLEADAVLRDLTVKHLGNKKG